jgi:S-adenosylmethionine:tRNA-ribosyltransferase-isomerase (queuine synthetase)
LDITIDNIKKELDVMTPSQSQVIFCRIVDVDLWDNREEYRVPEDTVNMVNEVKRNGKRVIVVGKTVARVLRALETVSPRGFSEPGTGWPIGRLIRILFCGRFC